MPACIWPHHVERLVGVAPCLVEELPQVCTCGMALTYSDDLVFITRPVAVDYNPARDEKPLTMAEWAEQMKAAVDEYAEKDPSRPLSLPSEKAVEADRLRKRTFGEWLKSFGRYISW